MNVGTALLARGAPEAVAVIDHAGVAITYGALRAEVDRVAAHLEARGVEVGARVLLVAENSIFFVAAYLGTLRAGCVVVPVSPFVTPEELALVVDSSRATAVFIQRKPWDRLGDGLSALHAVVEVSPDKVTRGATAFQSLPPASSPPADRIVDGSALASLMFTSGSTGRPRGVMISHANIAANTEAIVTYLELTASDRMMTVLPLHYCYGASLLHTHLLVGGSLVIDNRFMFADKVLQRMIATKCTGFAGVPTHFQILLRKSAMRTMAFPSLRLLQQAGGKLAEPLVEELVAAAGPARLFTMYGQTEATARLSYLAPEDLPAKLGSIGRGIPGVTLTICDEQGAPVSVGTVGEIVAEGASVARGYWEDDAATATTFREGRLYTGDLARCDAEGYITIVDRAKDLLKCGGVRTSSVAIESVLFSAPDVVEAVVIAVPDELLGEAPCAFLVLREGASAVDVEAALRSECAARLAPELMPKDFRFERALPKTSSGKPNKIGLRALLAKGEPS